MPWSPPRCAQSVGHTACKACPRSGVGGNALVLETQFKESPSFRFPQIPTIAQYPGSCIVVYTSPVATLLLDRVSALQEAKNLKQEQKVKRIVRLKENSTTHDYSKPHVAISWQNTWRCCSIKHRNAVVWCPLTLSPGPKDSKRPNGQGTHSHCTSPNTGSIDCSPTRSAEVTVV